MDARLACAISASRTALLRPHTIYQYCRPVKLQSLQSLPSDYERPAPADRRLPTAIASSAAPPPRRASLPSVRPRSALPTSAAPSTTPALSACIGSQQPALTSSRAKHAGPISLVSAGNRREAAGRPTSRTPAQKPQSPRTARARGARSSTWSSYPPPHVAQDP